MIWVIAFFIIILISSVLAYRSMRDYEEFPDSLSLTSIYYIGNSSSLNEQVLAKLSDFFLKENHFFALEKLTKGREVARVLYGTRDLPSSFPELNLVEIEDYLSSGIVLGEKSVSVDQTLSWLIEPKNNPKKSLVVDESLKHLSVEDSQKVFIQLVLMPISGSGGIFQSTVRVMTADPDPIKRVELAKRIDQLFSQATGLNKHKDEFAESKKFDSFKQRSLIPKEVSNFNLSSKEVVDLIS